MKKEAKKSGGGGDCPIHLRGQVIGKKSSCFTSEGKGERGVRMGTLNGGTSQKRKNKGSRQQFMVGVDCGGIARKGGGEEENGDAQRRLMKNTPMGSLRIGMVVGETEDNKGGKILFEEWKGKGRKGKKSRRKVNQIKTKGGGKYE